MSEQRMEQVNGDDHRSVAVDTTTTTKEDPGIRRPVFANTGGDPRNDKASPSCGRDLLEGEQSPSFREVSSEFIQHDDSLFRSIQRVPSHRQMGKPATVTCNEANNKEGEVMIDYDKRLMTVTMDSSSLGRRGEKSSSRSATSEGSNQTTEIEESLMAEASFFSSPNRHRSLSILQAEEAEEPHDHDDDGTVSFSSKTFDLEAAWKIYHSSNVMSCRSDNRDDGKKKEEERVLERSSKESTLAAATAGVALGTVVVSEQPLYQQAPPTSEDAAARWKSLATAAGEGGETPSSAEMAQTTSGDDASSITFSVGMYSSKVEDAALAEQEKESTTSRMTNMRSNRCALIVLLIALLSVAAALSAVLGVRLKRNARRQGAKPSIADSVAATISPSIAEDEVGPSPSQLPTFGDTATVVPVSVSLTFDEPVPETEIPLIADAVSQSLTEELSKLPGFVQLILNPTAQESVRKLMTRRLQQTTITFVGNAWFESDQVDETIVSLALVDFCTVFIINSTPLPKTTGCKVLEPSATNDSTPSTSPSSSPSHVQADVMPSVPQTPNGSISTEAPASQAQSPVPTFTAATPNPTIPTALPGQTLVPGATPNPTPFPTTSPTSPGQTSGPTPGVATPNPTPFPTPMLSSPGLTSVPAPRGATPNPTSSPTPLPTSRGHTSAPSPPPTQGPTLSGPAATYTPAAAPVSSPGPTRPSRPPTQTPEPTGAPPSMKPMPPPVPSPTPFPSTEPSSRPPTSTKIRPTKIPSVAPSSPPTIAESTTPSRITPNPTTSAPTLFPSTSIAPSPFPSASIGPTLQPTISQHPSSRAPSDSEAPSFELENRPIKGPMLDVELSFHGTPQNMSWSLYEVFTSNTIAMAPTGTYSRDTFKSSLFTMYIPLPPPDIDVTYRMVTFDFVNIQVEDEGCWSINTFQYIDENNQVLPWDTTEGVDGQLSRCHEMGIQRLTFFDTTATMVPILDAALFIPYDGDLFPPFGNAAGGNGRSLRGTE